MKRAKGSRTRRAVPAPVTPPSAFAPWRPALIVFAAVIVYCNSLSGPFVFDDRGTIIDNTTIESLSSGAVFSAPHETPAAGRPVVNISFAVNYAFGGRKVAGYHAVNIAIHLLCGLLVFAIARRAQPSLNAALAVGLIWAVHPLNTEAVDYITQRTESLMALFYLVTMYGAIRASEGGRSQRMWEAAAIVACALGMASKESMVTAPLAVMLYDRAFLFGSIREAIHRRGRLYAGLAMTWLVLGALLWTHPRNLSAGLSAHDADPWTYLLNQAVMITKYLRLVVWPRDLVLYYGWPLPLALRDVLPQALLVVTLLGAAVVRVMAVPADRVPVRVVLPPSRANVQRGADCHRGGCRAADVSGIDPADRAGCHFVSVGYRIAAITHRCGDSGGPVVWGGNAGSQ